MGNWVIVIEGCGCHHNDEAHVVDANRQAAEFVQALRDAGHTVGRATFTTGGVDDISSPKRYLDDRNAVGKLPRGPQCGKPAKAPIVGQDDGPCRLVEGHEGDCEGPVKWT